jgi:ABC-type uncharacterized transport system substrate-binding protein
MGAFTKALAQVGYTNKNLTIDEYWSDDDPQKLADNAHTLANDTTLNLIIAAGGTASVYALLNAQNKTKISANVVFTSFSQQNAPAPNMTGVNAQTSGLDVARMQYLYDLDQTQTTFGVLENQTRPNFDFSTLQDWADQTGVKLDRHSVYKYAGETDQAVIKRINDAFDDWGKKKIQYAQVCADPIFNDHRPEVTTAANRNKITVIYQWKEFRGDGAKKGDKVYGTDLIEAYTQAGSMAGLVLDLADPKDIAAIPVYTLSPQPLSLKRKTAKRRGGKRRR